MLLVDRSRVGVVAFSRLQREGLVHCAFGAWALPPDILSTRPVRAYLLAPLVPAHAWVTGLTALWLEGCCGPPPVIDLATARGAHRTEPKAGSPPLVFHTGKMWGIDPSTHRPRRTTLTRACLDALAHSPAATALSAVASGVRLGVTSVAELRAALMALDPRTAHGARVKSLVDALGCV